MYFTSLVKFIPVGKRQPMELGKTFVNCVSDKGFISKIYQGLLQSNSKKPHTGHPSHTIDCTVKLSVPTDLASLNSNVTATWGEGGSLKGTDFLRCCSRGCRGLRGGCTTDVRN